jgi:hypothetical protein
MTALSSADDPAHRLGDATSAAGRPEITRGEFTALVAVEDDPGDGLLAAADRDRHLQCGGGQVGVVVLAQGEPDDPP